MNTCVEGPRRLGGVSGALVDMEPPIIRVAYVVGRLTSSKPRGVPRWAWFAFNAAMNRWVTRGIARRLTRAGVLVVYPAQKRFGDLSEESIRDYWLVWMRLVKPMVIEGWRCGSSVGAQGELHLADEIGLPVWWNTGGAYKTPEILRKVAR